MKTKYRNRLRKSFIMFLSFLVSIGSFIGLFAVNAVQASAYNTTTTGQLKLESGVCYNGRNPEHPFIYTTERMAINTNTYLPTYQRGNDGAGGNIGGSTELLLKRINTGSAWSSVPLYRVSRSGGYSDDVPYVTGDATDIVSSWEIQSAINSLAGISRKISTREADMIKTVAINGFKAGLETTGSGNSFSWDDYLRCAATQILILEIQEGKRWNFGTADGNYRQEADTVGSNPWYWKQWWDNLVMPAAYPGATNWYYKIMDMCMATNDSMSVTGDNSGSTATATTKKSSAGTLNAQYYNGNYQLSFHVSNPNLWGNQYGQFNASGVEWIPDDGSRGASLSWSGSTGYLTSSNDRPDEPISGYLKFRQKASSGDFNDIGYMSGSTSNSWRGFMFGGNSTATELYIRVGSTGGPTPMTVKFVDENGSPVNVDWNFQVNDTNITEFTETSSGKTFVPQYYLDHHSQANYKINITSVPSKYQLPKELTTLFYYNSGTGILKHGTGAGSTGWGSWDYGACQASFNGNTITITLKQREQAPLTPFAAQLDLPDNYTGNTDRSGYKIILTYSVLYYDETGAVGNRLPGWKPAWFGGGGNFFNTSKTIEAVTDSSGYISFGMFMTDEIDATIKYQSDFQTDYNYKINYVMSVVGQGINADLYYDSSVYDGGGTRYTSGGTEHFKLCAASEKPDIEPDPNNKPVTVNFVDGNTGAPVAPTWSVLVLSDKIRFPFQNVVSAKGTFIPTYPPDFAGLSTNPGNVLINIALTATPQGYLMPDTKAFPFTYGVTDNQLKTVENGNYPADVVTLDTSRNHLTIKLYPESTTPEPPDEITPDIDISFLTPNSDYHFGEEVISSYYLQNKNDRAYSPATTELKANLTLEKVENGAVTPVADNEITNVVCPGNATQLIYFKWTVPALLSTGNERWQLHTYVYDSNGNQVTESVDEVTVANKTRTDTPPNKFDLNGGKSFLPVSPLTKNQDYYNSASWQQYVWENSGYVVKTYSAKLWNDEITVYPDETNPSATLEGGRDITSRSGYGMKLRLKARVDQYDGDPEFTNADQITAVQYAGAYYPEQLYSRETGKHSTLELTEAGFVFPVYGNSTYEPGEKGDGRKHFIPMWYPDGQYTVQCRTSGCWTPAGMIDYTDEANAVIIKGSLYDDWYSSGGGK